MENLKDCPFCGKEVRCVQNSAGLWIIEHVLPRNLRDCMHIDGLPAASREDKIRFWNRRV